MNGDNFDRVLGIQEKSIIAWEKAFNKIDSLVKAVDDMRDCIGDNNDKFEDLKKDIKIEIDILKEATKTILHSMKDGDIERVKTSSNEALVRWMKIIGGAIVLITTVVGAIVALS